MLEKFGWTKGSGLGKNKQGISENIRVQHKVNPTGIHYKILKPYPYKRILIDNFARNCHLKYLITLFS